MSSISEFSYQELADLDVALLPERETMMFACASAAALSTDTSASAGACAAGHYTAAAVAAANAITVSYYGLSVSGHVAGAVAAGV